MSLRPRSSDTLDSWLERYNGPKQFEKPITEMTLKRIEDNLLTTTNSNSENNSTNTLDVNNMLHLIVPLWFLKSLTGSAQKTCLINSNKYLTTPDIIGDRFCRNIQIPKYNLDFAKKGFSYSALKVWNEIQGRRKHLRSREQGQKRSTWPRP